MTDGNVDEVYVHLIVEYHLNNPSHLYGYDMVLGPTVKSLNISLGGVDRIKF